jgi:hypothetical protein
LPESAQPVRFRAASVVVSLIKDIYGKVVPKEFFNRAIGEIEDIATIH